jgi:maltose alpha-D-glucosyltransferase / alpha-amylase
MADSAVGKEIYPELRRSLPSQLPGFLAKQRWFGGKARQIRSAELVDVIPIRADGVEALLMVVTVKYAEGADESYAIPVVPAETRAGSLGDDAASLRLESSRAAGGFVVLSDALRNEAFLATLLELIRQEVVLQGEKGELRAVQTTAFPRLYPGSSAGLRPKPVGAEQSNSSTIYGDRLILKFFRRVEDGINPDLEVGNFLTVKAHFPHIAQVAGSLQYHTRDGKQAAQGILQAFVPNQGDAWKYTLGSLAEFYEGAARHTSPGPQTVHDLPEFARASAGAYLKSAALLGQRTAEMHLALASDAQDRAFAPEQFTMEFQGALETSMLKLVARVFSLLREKRTSLSAAWQSKAEELAGRELEIAGRFQSALSQPMHAQRTRIHGDYHLGQVLYTGSDFVIIDFEGEPARPLAERRIKRSPLQDVAGMLRSFHYAAFAALFAAAGEKGMTPEDVSRLSVWAETWNGWVADRFLASYFETAGSAAFLPESRQETQNLLDLHLLEKAVYELGYELNNRPTWVGIPLQGIAKLLSR